MESPQNDTNRSVPVRRRTAYACVSCRQRKTRCDGQERCSSCLNLGIECHYGHEIASSKGKSDLILSSILRLEQSIANIDLNVSALRQDVVSINPASHFSPREIRSETARTTSFSGPSPAQDELNEFSNATISEHTSTTEAILHWPIFDSFPQLRQENVVKSGAIFWMENSRQRNIGRDSTIPFLSEDELDRLIVAFSGTINFSYPIISQAALDNLRIQYSALEMDNSTRTCLTLLVMALGCAAETVLAEDNRKLIRLRFLGRIYFDAAVSRLHAAYSTISTESIQCLALTALYYAYLQRPIQAWSMLSTTATSCRVMLSYNVLDADGIECVRRIFWMCFILESDYLAELPALPRFGIADMESSVPLPGVFSQGHASQDDLSTVYFLACISMRRLLNRCHHLLFGQSSNKQPNSQRLSEIVSELDQQLEDWRQLLPPAIQFSIDTQSLHSQHGAFLRQRYLTCLALIHRPYIMKALSDHVSGREINERTITGARRCLQACEMHILNLRPFAQTVLVDVWICSLSMAGTMMIMLVASRIHSLHNSLERSIYQVGPHLLSLFDSLVDIHGEGQSPSVQQAIEWIKIVNVIIQQS